MNKKTPVLLMITALLAVVASSVYALTSTQYSMGFGIIADSSATANTAAYRDNAGNLALSQLALTLNTTTQLSTLTPPTTGMVVVVEELTSGLPGSVFTLCVSSAAQAGAWVYISSAANQGAGTAGGACVK